MNIKEKQKISNQIQQILFLIEKYKTVDPRLNLGQDLKSYFRKNKFLGSRDRRLIQNAIYTYFKWKIWINKIPNPYKEYSIILFSGQMNEKLKSYFDTIPELKNLPNENNSLTKYLISNLNIKLIPEDLFPKWMHDKLDSRIDLFEFNQFISTRAPIWLRVFNFTDELKNEFKYENHAKIKSALKLKTNTNVLESKAYKNGNIEIQDLGSQMIVESLPLKYGMKVWDVCAGAGGKTISIAKKLDNNCKILATDLREHSLKELIRRSNRCHIESLDVEVADVKSYTPNQNFDIILIDAPCSSSGTWRRNPAERWRLTEEEYSKLIITQRRILQNTAKYLESGSFLAYATCSIFREENESQIELFLKENPSFREVLVNHPLKKSEKKQFIKSDQIRYDADFMFVAVLEKI